MLCGFSSSTKKNLFVLNATLTVAAVDLTSFQFGIEWREKGASMPKDFEGDAQTYNMKTKCKRPCFDCTVHKAIVYRFSQCPICSCVLYIQCVYLFV